MPLSKTKEPAVHASVHTWKDISSATFGSRVLARLEAEGEAFRFDRMGHDEPVKVAFDASEAERLWSANISTRADLVYGYLILEKTGEPGTGVSMFWRKPTGVWLNSVGFWVNASHLGDPANVGRFLGVLADLGVMLEAGYGNATHSAEFEEKTFETQVLPNGRTGKRSIPLKHQDGLRDLSWANFFGPPYVRLFGRERLKTCPDVEVRWIGPGSCLLLTCSAPTQWNRPETQAAVEAAKDHLGRGAFYDMKNRKPPTLKPDWPAFG